MQNIELAEKKADGTIDVDARFGPDPRMTLRDGSTFPVRQYFAEQPQRTQWLAGRCKPILELIDHWRHIEGGSSEPARTLKSDVLCEWEAIAREAMLRWAVHEAHDILSLQHDGVVFALRPGVAVSDACRELEAACGGAVGYAVPVEKKDMSCDAAGPAPPVRPACGRHFGWGGAGGAGGGGVGRPSLVADRSWPLLPACRC